MEPQRVDLSQGGIVTVCLGRGFDVTPEFQSHPRVHFVEAHRLRPQDVRQELPPNTRAVVLTDAIPHATSQRLIEEFKRRRLLYLPRKSSDAVRDTLRMLLTHLPAADEQAEAAAAQASPAPDASSGNGNNGHSSAEASTPAAAIPTVKRAMAPRGSMPEFVKQHADLREGTAAEARRLMGIARKLSFTTTVPSLEQAIRVAKRKVGVGDRPASATPQLPRLTAIATLDEILVQAEALRKYVETTELENVQLKAKLARLTESFQHVMSTQE